jgi:hypothetical protein
MLSFRAIDQKCFSVQINLITSFAFASQRRRLLPFTRRRILATVATAVGLQAIEAKEVIKNRQL